MFAVIGWVIVMLAGLWFVAVSLSIIYLWYLADQLKEGFKKSWPIVVPFLLLGISIFYYGTVHAPFSLD